MRRRFDYKYSHLFILLILLLPFLSFFIEPLVRLLRRQDHTDLDLKFCFKDLMPQSIYQLTNFNSSQNISSYLNKQDGIILSPKIVTKRVGNCIGLTSSQLVELQRGIGEILDDGRIVYFSENHKNIYSYDGKLGSSLIHDHILQNLSHPTICFTEHRHFPLNFTLPKHVQIISLYSKSPSAIFSYTVILMNAYMLAFFFQGNIDSYFPTLLAVLEASSLEDWQKLETLELSPLEKNMYDSIIKFKRISSPETLDGLLQKITYKGRTYKELLVIVNLFSRFMHQMSARIENEVSGKETLLVVNILKRFASVFRNHVTKLRMGKVTEGDFKIYLDEAQLIAADLPNVEWTSVIRKHFYDYIGINKTCPKIIIVSGEAHTRGLKAALDPIYQKECTSTFLGIAPIR